MNTNTLGQMTRNPSIRPMPSSNIMWVFGWRWEIHFPGGGVGAAVTEREAEGIARKWTKRMAVALAAISKQKEV